MEILTRKESFMAVAKEQIRQIISENNISSVADVYSLLRDSFKDILQELLEAERWMPPLVTAKPQGWAGHRQQTQWVFSENYQSQFGEFPLDIPRDRNGEFEPKLVPKHQRDVSGIEEKVIALYARGMSTKGYP